MHINERENRVVYCGDNDDENDALIIDEVEQPC